MIAYCGMNCSKCDGYLATQADSDEKRKDVAEKWTAQYKERGRNNFPNYTSQFQAAFVRSQITKILK